ncbi:phosphatidylethanolamine-binding protein [Boletus coccyginus]|nr:phosphatidylethanolamine-binding protein [Boletus coccyginus]
MFGIRRFHTQSVKLFSTTAALQTASLTASVPEDASVKKRRTRPLKPRRPRISLEQPREWKRPLAYGVLPAFDEALAFIKSDSEALKLGMQDVQASLKTARQAPESDPVAIKRMEEKLTYLEIQSEINFPEVQWKCANGMADMAKTVDRHIIEQRWRKEGALDLLMERIHQMHVVPDVVPQFHPSFDLRVSFPEYQTKVTSTAPKYRFVEPGIYVLPEQTMDPPRLHKDVFHLDERLYTLIMVDPDVPDEANNTYQPFLHWLQPNIPMSATSPSLISNINSHTKYIPPHPQKGTLYHRYTVLLLPQTSLINVPILEMDERFGFSVRGFMTKYGLDPSTGGGAHMWRGEWNPTVSRIYQDLLKTDEPVYGKPPKPDRYADVRGKNRYCL